MVGERCWDQISCARGIDASCQSHSRFQNDHLKLQCFSSLENGKDGDFFNHLNISLEFCRFPTWGVQTEIPEGSQQKLEEKSVYVGKVRPLQISIFISQSPFVISLR